ncbi:zinc finger protein 732-like isoform X1 [Sergentomyia squamirostris]
MLENLPNWCRFCAKSDIEDGDQDGKMEFIESQLEIVNKYFNIKLEPFKRAQSLICEECESFVSKLENFKEQCLKTNEVFKELQQIENVSEIYLQSLRIKYDLNNTFKEKKCCSVLQQVSKHDNKSEDPLQTEFHEVKEELESPSPPKRRRGRPRKSTTSSLNNRCAEDFECRDDESTNEDQNEEKQTDDKPKLRPGRSKTEHICTICSKKCLRKYLLEEHMWKHSSKERPFSCSECPKKFITYKKLKLHEMIHLPDEQKLIHPCPHCEKRFSKMPKMQAHVRAVHIKEKPFICEECGKTFATNDGLKEHRIIHSDETPFQCSLCPKRFKNMPRLKQHLDSHNNTTYECPHCGIKLNTKATLKMHMVVHSDVKKYKCHYCGNEYKRSKALKNHLILHTGLRPYSCPFCDKTFANGSNCRSHKKKAHPNELAALESLGDTPMVTNVPKLEYLQPKSKSSSTSDSVEQ